MALKDDEIVCKEYTQSHTQTDARRRRAYVQPVLPESQRSDIILHRKFPRA